MTRHDDLVHGYARVRAYVRVAGHARGDHRVTRREESRGEKRRVDSINDSFGYDGGNGSVALQRTTATASYPVDGAGKLPVRHSGSDFAVNSLR